MQAREIKDKLKSLINEAAVIDPNLAKRLEEVNRWVKDVRPGSLTAKKFVMLFLQEIIKDAQICLDIKSLGSEDEQQVYYERMTPTERYWYGELLLKWLNHNDPKFYIWKQKLMAGEFNRADGDLIASIANSIQVCGGTVVLRFVADLSMATDIIISSRQEISLCIQLTSLADDLSKEKSYDWESTLRYWGIDKGLFFSYNPIKNNFVNQITNVALYNSDNLKRGIYLKFSL